MLGDREAGSCDVLNILGGFADDGNICAGVGDLGAARDGQGRCEFLGREKSRRDFLRWIRHFYCEFEIQKKVSNAG